MSRCHWIPTCLLVAAASMLLTGCLVRRTVTKGGEVVTDRYVVKRPLKDAVSGS